MSHVAQITLSLVVVARCCCWAGPGVCVCFAPFVNCTRSCAARAPLTVVTASIRVFVSATSTVASYPVPAVDKLVHHHAGSALPEAALPALLGGAPDGSTLLVSRPGYGQHLAAACAATPAAGR